MQAKAPLLLSGELIEFVCKRFTANRALAVATHNCDIGDSGAVRSVWLNSNPVCLMSIGGEGVERINLAFYCHGWCDTVIAIDEVGQYWRMGAIVIARPWAFRTEVFGLLRFILDVSYTSLMPDGWCYEHLVVGQPNTRQGDVKFLEKPFLCKYLRLIIDKQ